ncbi:serine carboxypeptidase [Hirsutella rhossiliensis]|uniref:Carboxypeptidase n=1 Tax=Hirsutella rhossiliensis TaxID=111463 RepID=A0A9P8MV88_9HYPO|nr:serine carboxypeptidase domain-containing protein [Hirsutella rhossiliensis]KAH0961779.1 serine carboxypeptidase domain-containing protein [Hirsutella rhossiliensis]
MLRTVFLTLVVLVGYGAAVSVDVPEGPLSPGRTNVARRYLSAKTQQFLVNGSAIPEVDFDIGESFAGLLPISNSTTSSLFFWFFPSENPEASEEITIWLNGGPGDSGMLGMLQGNGPFLWQPGTRRPVRNPYSWTNLTNVVYMDQPVGTGFSPGPGAVKDVDDIAEQFVTWFENFVQTFDLRRKVFITGESYAGHMIPYIASRMLDRNDIAYLQVKGIQIINSLINGYDVLQQAPAVAALNHYRSVFGLDETLVSSFNARADECGYSKFLFEALTYPPQDSFPAVPDHGRPGCNIWSNILTAAFQVNPCFNVYHLTDSCPKLWDVMQDGSDNYFNRPDVQKILNVPTTEYKPHGGFTWQGNPGKDALGPMPSSWGPLRSVIERTNNTMITHGLLDYLLLVNGTLTTIQNMTWNGARGFQRRPTEPFIVPDDGAGLQGTAHTERGLTFTSVSFGGHAMSQYVPAAAYRQLEFLLGRIQTL